MENSNIKRNPFQELYVTETISTTSFIKLFSPLLVNNAQALFQPGNIILIAVQGSGKSMLLNLLKPEVRVAYAKQRIQFPVPKEFSYFLGAGINLTRSGAIDFGQRSVSVDRTNNTELLPLFFGDFLNYWIVLDILKSIETLTSEIEGSLADEMGILKEIGNYDEFAQRLAQNDCWFGYLKDVNNYKELKDRLSDRILKYRSFLNFNLDELPRNVSETKTIIGEPISQTTDALRKSGIIPTNLPVYIRIDQYELLNHLEGLKEVGPLYRQVINKALSTRDPRVSYRIGTRRYAWEEDINIYGQASRLEAERDYKTIDLDEILRYKENPLTRKTYPQFVEDVFKRRLQFAGFEIDKKTNNTLREVFGNGLRPEDEAIRYTGRASGRILTIDKEKSWPDNWTQYLSALAKENPLSAKLAEAWVHQRGKGTFVYQDDYEPIWDKRTYWKKERVQQALMQIAAKCAQRKTWSGYQNVLSLSSGNILIFVSICQYIWGAWLRYIEETDSVQGAVIPKIDDQIQAVGIQEASNVWFNKIAEEEGGSKRQRFIRHIGELFYSSMVEDKSMSYPGNNGFSVKVEELAKDNEVLRFLKEAVDFGDLMEASHTTKTSDKKARKKWYLRAILSPYFKIPASHTKEPMYVSVNQVRKWLLDSQALNSSQLQLFPRKD